MHILQASANSREAWDGKTYSSLRHLALFYREIMRQRQVELQAEVGRLAGTCALMMYGRRGAR